MRRIPEEFAYRGAFDDLPGVKHGHHFAVLSDDAEIARDEDRCGMQLVDEPLDQIEDLSLDRDVEAARRLVGDQQPGIARQRHRDDHALGHSATKLMGIGVHSGFGIGNSNLGQHDHGMCGGSRLIVRAMAADDVDELLPDRDQGVQRGLGVLNDQPDLASSNPLQSAFRLLQQIPVAIPDGTRCDPARERDEIHQGHRDRRLAGSALPDDAQHLPLIDGQVDGIDRLADALAGLELDSQIPDIQQRRHWATSGSSLSFGPSPRQARRSRGP